LRQSLQQHQLIPQPIDLQQPAHPPAQKPQHPHAQDNSNPEDLEGDVINLTDYNTLTKNVVFIFYLYFLYVLLAHYIYEKKLNFASPSSTVISSTLYICIFFFFLQFPIVDESFINLIYTGAVMRFNQISNNAVAFWTLTYLTYKCI
jgi:hypothetical protein